MKNFHITPPPQYRRKYSLVLVALIVLIASSFIMLACNTSSNPPPKKYTINYTLNGGTHEDGHPTEHTNGTDTTLKGARKDGGFTFGGWFDNATFTGSAITKLLGSTDYKADINLYAKWNSQAITINYELNGGTHENENDYPKTHTNGIETPLKGATKLGNFVFEGWFDNANFSGNSITKLLASTTYTSINLYAKWGTPPATSAIVYSYKNFMSGQDITIDNVQDLPPQHNNGTPTILVNPTKTNWKFWSWYTTADFSGEPITQLSGDQSYPATINLYAKFSSIQTVMSGTQNIIVSPNKHTNGEETTLNKPDKNDYTFRGWNREFNFIDEPIVALSAEWEYTTTITLYANFMKTFCDINYNLGTDETLSADAPKTHTNGETKDINDVKATKNGAEFEGWYATSDFNGNPTTVLGIDPNEELVGDQEPEIVIYPDVINLYPKFTSSAVEQDGLKYRLVGDHYEVSGVVAQSTITNAVIANEINSKPVTSIAPQAFANCTNLKTLTINPNLETIQDRAFLNTSSAGTTTNLEEIILNDGESNTSEYLSVIDGVLFNNDATTLVYYPIGKKNNSYTVPSGVTTIGRYAFYGNKTITSITLPTNLKTIEYRAFMFSIILNLTVPEGTTTIEDEAFRESNLSNIIIPDSVINMGSQVFVAYPSGGGTSSIDIKIKIGNTEWNSIPGAEKMTPQALGNYTDGYERYNWKNWLGYRAGGSTTWGYTASAYQDIITKHY